MSSNEHEKSTEEKNREYWSERSNVYDTEEWVAKAVQQFTAFIHKQAEWIGLPASDDENKKEIKMLDFACGPGMASHALLPYVSTLRGIDIADGMVEKYNERAKEAGISPEKMRAARGDILADDASSEVNGPEFHDFDVVFIANALHHMDDQILTLKKLVDRLKPGGILVVLDFGDTEPEELKKLKAIEEKSGAGHGHSHGHGHHHHGQGHSHGHGHHHHGHGHGHGHSHGPGNKGVELTPEGSGETVTFFDDYREENISKMLTAAGCEDIKYELMDEPVKFGPKWGWMERRSFLARATKI